MNPANSCLPRGIVSVLQTPFLESGEIDFPGHERLVEYAVEGGVNGFLVPAVASEVEQLSERERVEIVRRVGAIAGDRVGLIVGASARDPELVVRMSDLAASVNAAGFLVAAPADLLGDEEGLLAYFSKVTRSAEVPLIIQDLDYAGSGLPAGLIERLRGRLPAFQGIKIETLPSGPKYTAVREKFGKDFYIAGGWAVPQMIEALDRSVDAMIPESSMIPVYSQVYRDYAGGRRAEAVAIFRRLLPVLAFSNQEIGLSIAFFKRLLVRKGIFRSETMRLSDFQWDEYNQRIADELIDLYLALEAEVRGRQAPE